MNATCHDCHRTLRPSNAPISEGTVRHEGHGRCTGCYRRRQRAGTLPEREKKTPCDTVVGPCIRCGVVRSYRQDRPNSRACSSCKQVLAHPEPLDDKDTLEDGRWVHNGRGILVWREDVAA